MSDNTVPPESPQPNPFPGEGELLAEADEVVRAEWRRNGPLAARRRRLVYALFDLGVFDIVGRDWVTVTDDGFAFADLGGRATDLLVRRLEDLAEGRPDLPARPGPGQLGLDLDAVPGPTDGTPSSSPHLGAIS